MTHPFRASVALVAGLAAYAGVAHAQGNPPGTVGRLAFADGSVSFHDQDDAAWTKAVVNTPLTSGDGIWTEPQAHSELSVAGARVRLDGATQLDMLTLDDSQTRLQLDQGRLDVRAYTLNNRTPYRIVTPRGTITLRQQGDYYVAAGSTEDATRLGVRSGSAELLGLNGQTTTVQPGQVVEISGDVGAPQLRTLTTAPPALPAYWAIRDKQVTYDPPTRYLSAGITGYEDLNAYGSWIRDGRYGDVWTPRSVPANWQPYRTGHWSNVKPWGWTWIDDQPWGYAPYHYGRWANSDNRWVWVPPQRNEEPVYAPALVAFIGGIELTATLGKQSSAPVGWFPLGPREAYVPSYATDRDYYNRMNRSAQIQQYTLDDRWQRTQRGERTPAALGNVLVNQRFATVVPSDVFVRSQPVARAALQVSPEKIAAAPVALVAAPPAPTASLAGAAPASTAPAKAPEAAGRSPAPRTPAPKAAADAKAPQAKPDAHPGPPVARTPVAAMPTLDKAAVTDKPVAPGPKITAVTPAGTVASGVQQPLPALAPRHGTAPPVLNGEKAPAAPAKPGQPEANAPKTAPAMPQGATPSRPDGKPEAKSEARPVPAAPSSPAPAGAPPKPPAPLAAPSTPGAPAISQAGPVDPKKPEDDKAADEKK